jgi:tetratricopeptide (TPR) repeat protein
MGAARDDVIMLPSRALSRGPLARERTFLLKILMNPDQILAEARQLMAVGNFADSAARYQSLSQLVPGHPVVLGEQALVFTQIKRDADAITLARQVLAAAPQVAVAHAAEGIALYNLNRPDDAIAPLEKAVEHDASLAIARQMLALCYNTVGRFAEAERTFSMVAFLNPGHPQARFSLAMRDLFTRNYAHGWRDYEWRWLTAQLTRPDIPRPRWDGRSLAGKSLLVHTEQGIGDAVQLVRLMPVLKKQHGIKLVFACQKALQPLLRGCLDYVDDWFPIDEPANINFDLYTPLLALPHLMGITEANLPKEVPYIAADARRVAKWKPILDAIPGFKIGIGWQGSATYIGDAYRSIPLEHFEALAKIPGVTLVCLQKGFGSEQMQAIKDRVPVVELPGLDDDGAFVDTAAVVQHLDLVVSCDSALTHITGALGRPVWLALTIGHHWLWQADRDDSPWYPTLRLFRQATFRDWPGVFARMAATVKDHLAGRGALSPPIAACPEVQVQIQLGELFDKISILELKLRRITDAAKRANISKELATLAAVRDAHVPGTTTLDGLVKELDEVNEAIWDNEEAMRQRESKQEFGDAFVAGARSTYRNNDRRARIKRQINELLGSRLVEEKSYGKY